MTIPVALPVKLDHAQHRCHDEEHEYRIQQDILRNGDTPSIYWKGKVKHIITYYYVLHIITSIKTG